MKYLFVFVFLMLIVNVSALQVQHNQLDANKTVGSNYVVELRMTNDENKKLFNVSIKENDYIISNKIDLEINETKDLQLTITTDETLSKTFEIQSFYFADDIGSSPMVYEVIINNEMESSACSFSVITGDTVDFTNTETSINYGKMLLRNLNTQIETTINANSTLSWPFTSSQLFAYKLLDWSGYQVADCQINVLPDTGYINDVTKNIPITFNINTFYPPTTISYFNTNDNYTMNFYETQDGILQISNTGSNIAKSIKISSEWIDFPTSIDILAGGSKNIAYSIDPKIYSTEETGKTYQHTILIEGNFETVEIPISIYINHAEVSFDGESNSTSFEEMIIDFCLKNPTICNSNPEIIYMDLNDSDMFNATLGEKQLQRIFTTMLTGLEAGEITDTYFKEQMSLFSSLLNQVMNDSAMTKDAVLDVQQSLTDTNSLWTFFGLIFSSIIICGLLIYLGLYYKKQKLIERFKKNG